MIVHNFNVSGALIGPPKADAVLVIDPDAVLPLAITAQRLKSIAGRAAEIDQLRSVVQHIELAFRHVLESLPLSGADTLAEEPFASGIREALDHGKCIWYVPRISQVMRMQSAMWRKIGIVFMWLVVVGQLGGIISELSAIERVLRNLNSTTVAMLNRSP